MAEEKKKCFIGVRGGWPDSDRQPTQQSAVLATGLHGATFNAQCIYYTGWMLLANAAAAADDSLE